MREEQPINKPLRVSSYVLRHWRKILLGFAMSLLTVWFNLAIPYITRTIIDGLTQGELALRQLILLPALYALASLLAAATSFWMRHIPLRIGHTVEADLRADVFHHLTTMDRAWFRTQRTGDLMNRMSSDMRQVAMTVGQGLMQVCRMVFVFFFGFAIMFSISARLAWLMLLFVPLMSWSFSRFARRTKQAHLAVQEELSRMAGFSQEAFAGAQTIKSFAVEPRWKELFRALNDTLVGRNFGLARVHEAIWPVAAFWLAAGSVMILVVGGRSVIRGEMTLGQLVQFNQYLLYLQWPLLSLGWMLSMFQRGKASWERIDEVLRCKPEIGDGDRTDAALQEVRGELVFDRVGVTLEGQTLLHEVSLTVPEGARVGITGPTGSGKTLLVSLVPRLIDPAPGGITIGGRDLREYPLSVLRAQIGMAEQEAMLFSDTLGKNIAFGLEAHSEEKVLEAAGIAHLHGDVEGFPMRYETMIGERGVTLSGGQRQRASISRAIVREPRILILDDVLASVDTATEAAILDNMRPLFQGRTTLFVSHRVSTLRDMDFIVVIEAGRITQQGTHGELVRRGGYYKRLCEIQELAARVN